MDKPFDDFDVYELDYLTHTETAPIRPTADAITTSAKEVIKPVMSRYRDVYVICHSLGGNVIRDYLTRIDAESPTELGRYRGLFLLGTPVEGSSLSRFLDLFGLLTAGGRADVKGALAEISGNPYLQSVNKKWLLLEEKLGRRDRPLTVWEAFERRSVVGVLGRTAIVVDKKSAIAAIPLALQMKAESEGYICGFKDKDHLSLPKPKDANDPVYKWVKSGITDGHGDCRVE
jgi:hypothetical protein